MFGKKQKRLTVDELSERLTKNSKIIQEDHDSLVELQAVVKVLEVVMGYVQDLANEVRVLQDNQRHLREALRKATDGEDICSQ